MSFESYILTDGNVKKVNVAKLLVDWRHSNAKAALLPVAAPKGPGPFERYKQFCAGHRFESRKLPVSERFFGKKKVLEAGLVFCFGFWFFQICLRHLVLNAGMP